MAPLSDGRREVLGDCVDVLDIEYKVEPVPTMLFVAKGLEEIAALSDSRGEVVTDCVGVLDVEGEVEPVPTLLSVGKGLEEIAPLLETEAEGLPKEAVPAPLADGR